MAKETQNTQDRSSVKQQEPQRASLLNSSGESAYDFLFNQVMSGDSIESQATTLSRLHPPQQQAMLQRLNSTHGNQYVQRVVSALHATTSPSPARAPSPVSALQTKLAVNEPGDEYEQEAEQVADEVMRAQAAAPPAPPPDDPNGETPPTPPPSPPATPRAAGISRLQVKGEGGGDVSPEVEQAISSMRGGGQPLPNEERRNDSTAIQTSRDLSAKAYTIGSDIAFNSGEFQPGTSAGRHLLAHELTHVVQQGGATTVQRKPEADEGVCPVCGRVGKGSCQGCGQPFQAVQRAPLEEQPQSKEAPAEEEGALPTEETVPEGKEAPVQIASGTPKTDTPVAEEVAGAGENPVAKGMVESVPEGDRATMKAKTEALQGEVEKAKEKGEADAAELPPEAKALQGEVGKEKKAEPDVALQGGQAKREGEQGQAEAAASEAQAALEAVNGEVERLASTTVNFAPIDLQALMGEGEGPIIQRQPAPDAPGMDEAFLLAMLEERRARASALVNEFMANASGRVQQITAAGQTISPRLQAAANDANASIQAAMQQQQQAIATQVAQAQAQAQSKAQASRSQLQAQHTSAVTAIRASTAASRQELESNYATSLERIAQLETEQLQRLDVLYAQTDQQYRAVGRTVGSEASAIGNAEASRYLGQKINRMDSLTDGYLTDRRCEARANAAREVANQYRQGLIDAANEQATEAQKGKPNDRETIRTLAKEARKQLADQHRAALTNLRSSEAQAITSANKAKRQLQEAITQALQATTQTLNQQKQSQLQTVTTIGQQQMSAITTVSQQASASLQQAVTQAAASLQSQLASVQGQAASVQAPDPDALAGALSGALGQIDGAVSSVQGKVEQGVSRVQQSLAQQSTQSTEALAQVAQSTVEQVTETITGFDTTLASLDQGATDAFTQLQEWYQSSTKELTTAAQAGYEAVTTGTEQALTQIGQNVEEALTQSVPKLEAALRGALEEMRSVIAQKAEEAAAQEQPAWKTVAKIVLVIAVIVVVALVIGPAVIGAVGAAAGALGASAAAAGTIGAIVGGAIVGAGSGAVIQMGSNLIDGKNLMDGVLQAAIVGAIGGALGGAGGALGQALGNAGRLGSGMTKTLLEFGIDTAFDITGSLLGDFAVGNAITLEGLLIGAGIGAAVSIGTSGMGRVLGGSGGTPEVSVGKPNVEAPTPRVDTSTPSTRVDAGDGSVPTPRPDTSAPSTRVDAGDSSLPPQVKSDRPITTHLDEPQIEPGVVAKQATADGHTIKVLPDGSVVKCSVCGKVRTTYADELAADPALKAELDAIEAIPDPILKAQRAADFDLAMDQLRKGGTGGGFDGNSAALAQQAGLPNAPKNYNWFKQPDGSIVLRRNPLLKNQLPPLKYDPEAIGANRDGFVPAAVPPQGYKWNPKSDGTFEIVSTTPELPAVRYDPAQGGFVDLTTGRLYVPPSAANGNWGQHEFGKTSVSPCFAPGTPVKTPEGDRAIESLQVGDLVFAYDFESGAVIKSPVMQVHQSRTRNLVDVRAGGDLVRATRLHQFWVESAGEWVAATQLQPGMGVRLVSNRQGSIDSAETYPAESTTYNLEIMRVANYFVGRSGILVHNGGPEESNFADTTKKKAHIYLIRDLATGEVIYVGKTVQHTIQDRFGQHLTSKPEWRERARQGLLQPESVFSGEWTDYETAVWERHYIDQHTQQGVVLENDPKSPPISREKYNEFKHLHNPCP